MSKEYVIRKMEHTDVSTVDAIERLVEIDPWDAKLYDDCIDIGYECIVLAEEGKVVGFGILSFSDNSSHILNLAVLPSRQRLGYGKKLLEELLVISNKPGIDEVRLEVRESNAPARNLYTKHNFVEIGIRKDYYPAMGGFAAEDGIAMVLPLRTPQEIKFV